MVVHRENLQQIYGNASGVEHRALGDYPVIDFDANLEQEDDDQQLLDKEHQMTEPQQNCSNGNFDQLTHQMTQMMQGLMSDFIARQERRLDGLTGTIVAECEKRIRQEVAKLGTQSQATNVSSSSPPSQLFPSTANMTLLGHSSQRPAFSSARQQQTGTGQQRQHITFPQNQQLSVQQPAQNTDPLMASMDRMTKANMEIMRQFIAVNEGNQFAMISNQISNLSGNEGRTGIKNFFGNLEASTPGWSVDRRAQLLATHLTGAAKNLFESMDDWEKVDYDRIKEQVLESMSGLGSKRHEAKAILERGLWPAPGDNLREYGLRVLALMRDSKIDGTPNATVEDDAKCYFLGKMHDSRVHDSLAMWMDDMVYRDLIDKAEKLRQNLEIRRTNMGPRFNQGFNSSTVNRPAPAFVPNSGGSTSNQQNSSNAPANFSTNKNQTWSARPNYQNSSNANFMPVNRNLQAPPVNTRFQSTEEVYSSQQFNHFGTPEINENVGYISMIMDDKHAGLSPRKQVRQSAMARIPEVCQFEDGGRIGRRNDARACTHSSQSRASANPVELDISAPYTVFHSKQMRFTSALAETEGFADLDGITQRIQRSKIDGSAHGCLIFLPAVVDGDESRVDQLMDACQAAPHCNFYIVPPPSMRSVNYDKVVDKLLSNCRSNVFTRHEHRGRTLYSIGWNGVSLNNFHSVRGQWTAAGLQNVVNFLVDNLGLKWAMTRVKALVNADKQRRGVSRTKSANEVRSVEPKWRSPASCSPVFSEPARLPSSNVVPDLLHQRILEGSMHPNPTNHRPRFHVRADQPRGRGLFEDGGK